LSRETPRWFIVARILRARGNKGEVAAEILTDFPERLARLREVFVGHADGKNEPRRLAVKSCWLSQNHRGQAVFHFVGVASISEAEKFRGLDVLLPFEQRVTLPAGRYFVSDLIGCSVLKLLPCLQSCLLRRARLPKRRLFSGPFAMCNFPGRKFPGRRSWKWKHLAAKF